MATLATPVRTRKTTHMTELPMIAVGDQFPEEHIKGRFSFYSLPDEERSGALLMDSWTRHGLDPDTLPEARQPVHVFQSACASVQERTGTDHHTGHRIQILANEVTHNSKVCAYQITVRRWAGDVIEHDKTMTVTFDKKSNKIDVTRLDGFDRAYAGLQKQIREHFTANAQTVPGQKVRNAIRKTLLDCGAVNLRRKAGGLYFVPRVIAGANTPTGPILEGLAAVLDDLYGDRADFHSMKCAGDPDELSIIRKHTALNVDEKAQELAQKAWARVRQGRGDRGVRSDLIANLENDRRTLLGVVKQFEELVSLDRAKVQNSLDELDDALGKLDELANQPTT